MEPTWLAARTAERLADLRARNLYRSVTEVQERQGPIISVEGKELVNLAANNPLGLANAPALADAVTAALATWGTGAGASRLVSGQLTVHRTLESGLARFKRAEAALVFATGYMANLGALTALAGPGDLVLLDKLCHASLFDGARLSGARLRTYPHLDLARLEHHLERHASQRCFVVTDSLFSMDGDLAPLPDMLDLCNRHDAALIVDEAHATGVLGARGSGAIEAFGLAGQIPVTITTLSKSLGGLGGAITGSHGLIELVRNTARSFIYTTGLPPILAGAAQAALDHLFDEGPDRGRLACQRARQAYEALHAIGVLPDHAPPPAAHILPVIVGSSDAALTASHTLREHGLFAPAIRPPTVPKGTARIRLSFSCEHTEAHVACLAKAWRAWPHQRVSGSR